MVNSAYLRIFEFYEARFSSTVFQVFHQLRVVLGFSTIDFGELLDVDTDCRQQILYQLFDREEHIYDLVGVESLGTHV